MSHLKKRSNKVVDNLTTQLQELLDALNRLYECIDKQMTNFASNFDEINTILVEGFRDVLDQKPPNDVVEDASSYSSGSETEDDEGNSSNSGEECTDDDEVSASARDARKAQADEIMRMIQSWTA